MSTPEFRPATRRRTLLRLAIAGPSGSGKTYSGLRIGTLLAKTTPGFGLGVIDTEHGSAEKYADQFAFEHLVLGNFNPRYYIDAIAAAAATRRFSVLLIDSLSHAWGGTGGVLDQVDRYSSSHRGDNFGGWRETRPLQRDLVEAMLAAPMHIIVTMRTKQAYAMEPDERGKNQVRKLGLKPEQADGIEYEFDIAGEVDIEHRLTISKSRASKIADKVYPFPGEELVADLVEWIGSRPTEPQEAPVAAPVAAPAEPDAEPPFEPEAAPAPAAAPPAPEQRDDRPASPAQIRRLQTMGRTLDAVSSGTITVLDLARFAVRDLRTDVLTSSTLLTRTEIEAVYDLIDEMASGPHTSGRILSDAIDWLETQPLADDIPAGDAVDA